MAEIDNEVVERVLAGLRNWDDHLVDYSAKRLADGDAGGQRIWRALVAATRDPSLFRALELRRAELLREQDFPGGVAGR